MRKTLLTLLLLAAACATTDSVGPVFRQADYRLPQSTSLDNEPERAAFEDALRHATLGDVARESGNMDQARGEWRLAGTQLGDLAAKFPSSEYRMVYRATAARFLIQGGDPAGAAGVAEMLRNDPQANQATKAMGSQLRASALQSQAFAEVKANQLEPLRVVTADKRKGADPKPRQLPESWRKVVSATDDYLSLYKSDPAPSAPQSASALAMLAAQAQLSSDNLEDANRRLAWVMENFPSSPYFPDAVSLYLQTYLIQKDEAGFLSALDRSRAAVAEESRKAAAAAKGSSDADLKARADQLARLDEELARQRLGMGFKVAGGLLTEAQRLEGEPGRAKAAEAAAAFEKFAAEHPDHPDAASALYNAAIAWARAKEPQKAQAARELLMARHPDAKIAPKAVLAVAGDLSATGDHAGAAQRYLQYLERYPGGEDRCLALQNVGAELDAAKQPDAAARRYLIFGADAACAKEDPNGAVKMLYRAAALYSKAKKKPETNEALRALLAVPGVSDPVARSYVDDARARLK